MAKELEAFKGIPCPMCSETDGVKLNLASMEFSCTSCDKEWTVDDVEAMLAIWARVLKWIDMIPPPEE